MEAFGIGKQIVATANRHNVYATLIEHTELGRALNQDLRRRGVLYPLLQQSRDSSWRG